MSSTTGTIRHPEVSEISDLTEGLLSPTKSSEVRLHLTECPLCADVLTSLEEIRGLLGTLPGPYRMPADIAGRIDAALAAEALLDATSPERDPSDSDRMPAADVSPPATAGGAPGETSPARTAPTPPAPGGGRPAGRPGAASGPGRTRSRRRVAVLAGMAAAAALSVAVFLVQNLETGSYDEKKATSISAADSPGQGFTAAGLEADVQRLLGGYEGTAKVNPLSSEAPRVTDMGREASPEVASGLSAGPAVPSCITAGIGRSEAPLAAEPGDYQGRAAYLVVLPHPGDTSRADAYVVDAACTSGNPAGRGSVLLTGSYPRS